MRGLTRKLLKVFPVLSIRAASAATLYCSQLLIVRLFLDDDAFGQYAIFTTIVNLVAILFKGGLDTASIRFTSSYRRQGDHREHSFFLFVSAYSFVLLLVLYGITLVVPLGALLRSVGATGSPHEISTLVISVFSLSYSQLQRANIVAKKHPVVSELHNGILRPIATALLMWLYMGVGRSSNYQEAITAHALATLLALLLGFLIDVIYRKPREGGESTQFPVFSDIRHWLGSAWSMALNVVLRQVFKSVDVLICGALLAPSKVAYYAAATRIANLVVFGLSSTNMVFAPRISERYSEDDKEGLTLLIREASSIVFTLGCCIFLGLALTGTYLLSMFGEKFASGYAALLILSGAQLINSFYGPIGYLASMTGNERLLTRAILTVMPLSLISYVLLVPLWGLEGAAVGSAIGTAGWNIVLNRLIKKRLNIDSSALRFS